MSSRPWKGFTRLLPRELIRLYPWRASVCKGNWSSCERLTCALQKMKRQPFSCKAQAYHYLQKISRSSTDQPKGGQPGCNWLRFPCKDEMTRQVFRNSSILLRAQIAMF